MYCVIVASLAACHEANPKLIISFTVNTAFVNYLDQIENLTETLDIPFLMDKTTVEHTLPISLNASNFDSDLLKAPKTRKTLFISTNVKRKFLIWKKGMSIQA